MNWPFGLSLPAVCLAVVVGLAGCATHDADSLADWQGMELKVSGLVAEGVEVPLAPELPMTLRIDADGKVSGRAAVNRYFGSFTRASDGTLVWQGSLGATRMAGPPEAMKLEAEYLRTLPRTSEVKAGKETLVFQSADGKNRVQFVRS